MRRLGRVVFVWSFPAAACLAGDSGGGGSVYDSVVPSRFAQDCEAHLIQPSMDEMPCPDSASRQDHAGGIAIECLNAPNLLDRMIVDTNADNVNSVFAADMDGDGDTDFLSASINDDTIAWYQNNGGVSPTFTKRVISNTANSARSVFAADVNGDGDMDALSASALDGTIAWYENSGESPPTFVRHVINSEAPFARSVFAIDLDGDLDVDVLSASTSNRTIAWYENDGGDEPAFTTHLISNTATSVRSVSAADVNGDGLVDVLAGFGTTVAWFENDGGSPPSFMQWFVSSAVTRADTIAVADLDGDLDMDLTVTTTDGGGTVLWFENDGANVPEFTEHTLTDHLTDPGAVFATDMDSDRDVDVVVASLAENKIAWFNNDGGSFPGFTLIAVAELERPSTAVGADVNGDNIINIVAGSISDDTVAWYAPAGPFELPPVGACCLPEGGCAADQCFVDCAASLGTAWNEDVACGEATCPGESSPATFLVDSLDFGDFKQRISDLADLQSRHISQPGNAIAEDMIADWLLSFGYDNVTRDPFNHLGARNNIYATKIGSERPDEMYIIGAHLDSILFFGLEDQSVAPGADDDASGVSSVLEIARAFGRARTDVSIRFILFNAEEQGRIGSIRYVQNHRNLQGTPGEPRWLGMIQQDMILYDRSDAPDADVEFQDDANAGGGANILASFIAGAMSRYGDSLAEVGDEMSRTDSESFQDDTVAVSVRENRRSEIGLSLHPHFHRTTDLFESYTGEDYQFGFNIVKMVCGALGELTGARLWGDGDGDGDVDLLDYRAFSNCRTSPGVEGAPGCEIFDFDEDGDIDLLDAGAFQRVFGM